MLAIAFALLFALQSFPSPGPGRAPVSGGGGGPTITTTSALCVGNAGAAAASCTLAASAAVGDLLVIISKSSTSDNAATVAFTFSGTAACTPTSVLAPGPATWQSNGSGHFITAMSGCIVTSAGAATPVATWTTADGTFTDVESFTVHTSNTWKTTFTDAVSTPVIQTTTSTSCPTGTATTTNSNDFVVAVCQQFNAGQTWGTLSGFTNLAGASRNVTGTYYKTVSSAGAQSATVPLSASDLGLGFIVGFASN